MSLSQLEFKELESQNAALAKDVGILLKHAQELGAKEGVQRLAFVSKHFQKLSLEEAYHLINPHALQSEIEEAQAGKYWIGFWQVARNSFGVAPLILTWFALFRAVSDYQADLKRHPLDAYQPFLALWQNGFNHTSWLTFSVAALIDVMLLLTYLALTLVVPILENRARTAAEEFAEDLEKVINELTNTMAKAGNSSNDLQQIIHTIDASGEKMIKTIEAGMEQMKQTLETMSSTDVDNIAKAIERILNKTLKESLKVTEQAKVSIEKVTEATREAIQESNKSITGVITSFQQDLQVLNTNSGTLNTHLTALNTNLQSQESQVKELTFTTAKIAGASLSLAQNADELKTTINTHTATTQNISTQIGALNTTQQQIVTELRTAQQQVVAELKSTQQEMVTKFGTTQDQVVKEIASTQDRVVQQLDSSQQQIARTIATYQGHMVAAISGASDKMQGAATAALTVADTLGRMTKEDIVRMTRNVANAADRVADTAETMGQINNQLYGTLSNVNSQLQGTTRELYQAAMALQKAADIIKRPPWWVRIIPRRKPRGTGTPPQGVIMP